MGNIGNIYEVSILKFYVVSLAFSFFYAEDCVERMYTYYFSTYLGGRIIDYTHSLQMYPNQSQETTTIGEDNAA